MCWFKEEFGFDEEKAIRESENIKNKVTIIDEEYNIFETKTNVFYGGKFEYPKLEDLTFRLRQLELSVKSFDELLFQSKYYENNSNNSPIIEHKEKYEGIEEKNSEKNNYQKEHKYSDNKKIGEDMNEDYEILEIKKDQNSNNEKLCKKGVEDEKIEDYEIIENKNNQNSNNKDSYKKGIDEKEEQKYSDNIKIGLTFKHLLNTSVKTLICNSENNGAVFQVASQFNCLEMIGPSVTPDSGITKYALDQTQGPACVLCCRSGLFARNYLINETGQIKKQINLLSDVEKLLNNDKNKYWYVKNGYCLTDNSEQVKNLKYNLESNEELCNKVKEQLRIGIHWETEVNLKKREKNKISPQVICQIFCSTLALSYDKVKIDQKSIWDPFCRLVLEGMYEATLTAAVILSKIKKKRIKVYLTAIGGGVFGNPLQWIADAIKKSLQKHKNEQIDVFMVHYSSIMPKVFEEIKFK